MRVINNKTQQIISIICFILLICTITIISKNSNNNKETLTTSSAVNNQKIGWGIKRNDNHEQPDLGKKNKEILKQAGVMSFMYLILCLTKKISTYI